MAYVDYGQATVGGKQVAEWAARLQALRAESRNLAQWVAAIGPTDLVTNTDFLAANGQAFNDTVIGIANAVEALFTANGNEIENKLASIARGD